MYVNCIISKKTASKVSTYLEINGFSYRTSDCIHDSYSWKQIGRKQDNLVDIECIHW